MYIVISTLFMIIFWTVIVLGANEGKFSNWFFVSNRGDTVKFDWDYFPLVGISTIAGCIITPLIIFGYIGYKLGQLVYQLVKRFI